MCQINRASIYVLLSIMIHLCCLTYNLYTSLDSKARFSKKREAVLQAFCVGFPIVLVIFGYSLDTDDPDVASALLNVARHGFKCSMRFASMKLEWIGIWARM
jgi:hypothetical protein